MRGFSCKFSVCNCCTCSWSDVKRRCAFSSSELPESWTKCVGQERLLPNEYCSWTNYVSEGNNVQSSQMYSPQVHSVSVLDCALALSFKRWWRTCPSPRGGAAERRRVTRTVTIICVLHIQNCYQGVSTKARIDPSVIPVFKQPTFTHA